MNRTIVISDETESKFDLFMQSGRVILFEAPCGFGKTTAVKALLRGYSGKIKEVFAEDADFDKLEDDKQWDILFVDDLHMISDAECYKKLCTLIRNKPDKRFVLASRGAISGELIPFRIAGLLMEINEKDMFFDKKLTAQYLTKRNIHLSETELNSLMEISYGYPLVVEMYADRLSEGEKYGKKLSNDIKYSLYNYFDEMIFCRFEMPVRRFLLELAPFESLNTELAKMVSGDSEAGILLAGLQKKSRMLCNDGDENFYFWPVFRRFLLWEQNRYYTAEQQRAIFSRGGLYYELKGEYAKALEFYSKSAEKNKVSELIIKITGQHPGMGYYEELEKYFLMLSDDMIKASPALMQGKCMLCSLHTDYDGSEKWYNELKKFVSVRSRSDAAAKEARTRLVWLDIALPQRGVTGMIDTIGTAFRLITDKEIRLMPFSVTSTLPSIMNGGKDFSIWSKKDDFLYATMRVPVVGILGKDGIGLPECAIAESKFEKGENISDRMLTLVSRLTEIQNSGTPDIEFALVGLLVRERVDAGKVSDARHTLELIRQRFAEKNLERFMPNIDAMMCRLALRENDAAYAEEWYRDKAPRDALNIRVMRRYQYFTEAMADIYFGNEDAALLTLSPLEPYCERCGRYIDTIHLKILSAIARFRKKDKAWKEELDKAVGTAEKFGFVHTISTYGAAILPLLEERYKKEQSAFVKKVIKAARIRAVYYPNYLKPQKHVFEKLTEAEIQVLHLVCADKSNSEIGEILSIQLATVKSHVSHILQKLGASRRSEAKAIAERMHII